MTDLLAGIVKGRIEQPMRLVLYGPPGIGKSTFASHAPSPIFLGAEKGTAELDIARFPQPATWTDALMSMTALLEGEHGYKTFVLDTLDWLEPLCWQHVCKAKNKKAIEDFGYGKGYAYALDEWRRFVAGCDALSERKGMHIILLAHCHIRSWNNPAGDNFDRYELKLHAKSSSLVTEWADELLFCNYETFTREADNGKTKGVSNGARVVHTVRNAVWDAKNRHGLPERLPLSWEDYAAAVGRHEPPDVDALVAKINGIHEGVEDERLFAQLKDKAAKALAWADGDPQRLVQGLDRLTALRGDA